MGKYLKEFESHSQYESYTADTSNFIKPNVSFCVQEHEVHYNPFVETRVVAKFNVTSTSSPTKIAHDGTAYGPSGPVESSIINNFTKIEIDGVEQPSLITSYTFNTIGEHIVKYTLLDSTTLNTGAFASCSSLTSIDIPNTVTSIGSAAFMSCGSLTSIGIPNRLTNIGNSAFASCSSLTSIDIPNGVTSIGDYAFISCGSLTSIDIPSSITTINSSLFNGCSGITSVTIPSSVTSIGGAAFFACGGLTNITIPSSVTSIGYQTFEDCSGLTSIVCNATTAPTITSSTFRNVKTGGTLTVPSGSSGYDTWMQNSNYYLGLYNWTKVEQ